MTRLAGLLVVLAACGGADVEPAARDQRFVGLWAVEQPYHALYELTFYRLQGSGAVEQGATVGLDLPSADFVTGTVGKGDTVCRFASSWHSLDAATLVIASRCSDGQARDVILSFANAASGNAVDAGVQIISVGGETGWAHPGFEWRFRRCADEASCSL